MEVLKFPVFPIKTHRKSPDFASFPSKFWGIFVFFPSSPALAGGTRSFQLREKTAAIDRSRGVRFQSVQELYLTLSRRKVIEDSKSRIFQIFPLFFGKVKFDNVEPGAHDHNQ